MIHQSFRSNGRRVIAVVSVVTLTVVATAYGLASSDDLIEATPSPSETTMAPGETGPPVRPSEVVLSSDLKSIGPLEKSGQEVEEEVVEEEVEVEVATTDAPDPDVGTSSTTVPPLNATTTTTAPAAAPAPLAPQPAVFSLKLTNARSGYVHRGLGGVANIDVSGYDQPLAIVANVSPDTERVKFYLNGSIIDSESEAPYRIRGRTIAWLQERGEYRLTAVAFASDVGGSPGRQLSAIINVY